MQIELRAVSKSYQAVRALDGISLVIEPGQIVGLLGMNGAGKTTLIRCLAGMVAPDRGELSFDNEVFQRDKLHLRRRIHILPDFPPLFWEQSVLRNIAMVLHLYGADGAGVEDRVLELLCEFDLLPLGRRPASALSRGQAYKVALVAMIAADRDIWLLDEPFASGMDPLGIDAFRRHAQAAAQRGRIVIYSTQILDIAERFSDRVCVVHDGTIRAFGTLDELRTQATDKNDVLQGIFRQLRESPA